MSHMKSNLDVFDFEIEASDMYDLGSLDEGIGGINGENRSHSLNKLYHTNLVQSIDCMLNYFGSRREFA